MPSSTLRDSQPSLEITTQKLFRPERPAGGRLSIDIEREPTLAYVWGLWDQNIPIHHVVERGKMVSFAAIKDDDRDNPIFRSIYHDSRTKMLNDLAALLAGADELVTYNGVRFDIKHVRTEMALDGMDKLIEPRRHLDLLAFVKKTFASDSNKLDWWVQQLKIGRKADYGMSHLELLKRCAAQDKEAKDLLREYNIQDSLLNLQLRDRLIKWL